MLPILNIGPLAIQLPGLLLLVGLWVGSILAERAAKAHGVSPDSITNLIFYSLVAGVIGARIGYAIRFLPIYLENPLGLISLNPSTLSIPEGLLVGVLTALIYGQRAGLTLWPTLDALTPGLATFAIALGLAHLASGDAFGAPSEVPWAIELWGAQRHPTQIYEILLASLSLAIIMHIRAESRFPGFRFLIWLSLISASYLIVIGFRGDSVIVFGALRQGQIISLILLVAALLGLHLRAREELMPAH